MQRKNLKTEWVWEKLPSRSRGGLGVVPSEEVYFLSECAHCEGTSSPIVFQIAQWRKTFL